MKRTFCMSPCTTRRSKNFLLTFTQSGNHSSPDRPECFCESKNVSKERGVAHNSKFFLVPLPIRYISSFFYKNSETLRAIGIKSTFFFITTIFFLPTFIHGKNAELISHTTQETTNILIKAEDAVTHEAYDTAREQLLELVSWPLDDMQTLFRLGITLIKIGEFQTSVDIFKRILKTNPHNTTVLYNCGYALKSGGRIDEALPYYQAVLAREPENDGAHLALGFAYLNKGDFAHGWPQHDRYLKKSGKYAPELRALLGNNFLNASASYKEVSENKTTFMHKDTLAGKRILLVPEGGFGDTINFIQCAQLLRDQGAYVLASVQKPLVKLLQHCDCVDEVFTGIPTGLTYDAKATYMSLPAALRLDETIMPKRTPFIVADPELVGFWKETLSIDTNIKIGVCWQADVPHDESRLPVARRSIPLALLAQLATIPGVTLYSLQTHKHNSACTAPEIAGRIQTFDYAIDTEHGPFMDTAALIMNMDLVISVDTATAHLAAALGKPIWLLLPYSTDWRWIAGRTDSPWHPTMRIFKQPAPFDWQSVIDEAAKALLQKVAPC